MLRVRRTPGRLSPRRVRRHAARAVCWGTGRGTRTSAPSTRCTRARCCRCRRRRRRRRRCCLPHHRLWGCGLRPRCRRPRSSRQQLSTLQLLWSPCRRQSHRLPRPQTQMMCPWRDGRTGTPCTRFRRRRPLRRPLRAASASAMRCRELRGRAARRRRQSPRRQVCLREGGRRRGASGRTGSDANRGEIHGSRKLLQ